MNRQQLTYTTTATNDSRKQMMKYRKNLKQAREMLIWGMLLWIVIISGIVLTVVL